MKSEIVFRGARGGRGAGARGSSYDLGFGGGRGIETVANEGTFLRG